MWYLIDLGYFSFYRYYATKKWWGFKKEENQVDPWINEKEFKEKLIQKYEEYLDKFVLTNNNVFLAMDAMDGKNWRKELYPSYKSQRPKNNDIFDYLKYMFKEFLYEYAKKHPNVILIRKDGTEADDLIAQKVFELKSKNREEEICIIASDMDYLQLIEENNKICIKDMNLKLLSNKEIIGKKYLKRKIIYGDNSDNIKPIYSGKNSTKKKKELFEKFLQFDLLDEISVNIFENEEAYNKFIINRKLIELVP